MAERIQRKRIKGWKMPEDAVSITRPGPYGNPFRIGGYFMVGPGRGRPGMAWCEALDEKYADARFTKIETRQQAVEMFKLYAARYPMKLDGLRGKNLACWCPIGQPCHGDVLLSLVEGVSKP